MNGPILNINGQILEAIMFTIYLSAYICGVKLRGYKDIFGSANTLI